MRVAHPLSDTGSSRPSNWKYRPSPDRPYNLAGNNRRWSPQGASVGHPRYIIARPCVCAVGLDEWFGISRRLMSSHP
jgi:hypothetical protein